MTAPVQDGLARPGREEFAVACSKGLSWPFLLASLAALLWAGAALSRW